MVGLDREIEAVGYYRRMALFNILGQVIIHILFSYHSLPASYLPLNAAHLLLSTRLFHQTDLQRLFHSSLHSCYR